MFTGMAYSIISPLFPTIAERHGMNEDVLGYLISTCALSSFCAAPFVPMLVKNFGRIDILYVATFGEATCVVLYGFFNFIPSYYLLITISFTIRAIHGLCGGIVGIMVYSLISCISTEDEIQMALGNMEVAWCIGLSAGPLFASIFYEIGGYFLPFLALGGTLYVSVYLTKIISSEKINSDDEQNKANKDNKEEEHSLLKIIFHCDILMNLGTVTIGIIVTTYYFPCLSNHLTQKYHLSVSIASLFFVVGMVFYMFFLQFLTKITNKYGMHGTPCIGLLMTAIGCIFIYPVPPIPQSLIFILFGLCMAGGAGAPINVPALINLSKDLKIYDQTLDDFTANDIASTLYTIVNNIGDFIGPTLGGFLSSKYGFKNCCLIISFFIFIYLFLFIFTFHEEIKKEYNSEQNEYDLVQIKEEFNNNNSLLDNNSLNNTFITNINDLFGSHFVFIRRKQSIIKKRFSGNKLNRSLLSSLTN
jgi:predicted MFS family arabinose efflux permease